MDSRKICPQSAGAFVISAKSHFNRKENMSKSETKQAASIVWFEIPADNPERAKAFYGNLFGCLAGTSIHFPEEAIIGTSTLAERTIRPTAR